MITAKEYFNIVFSLIIIGMPLRDENEVISNLIKYLIKIQAEFSVSYPKKVGL